MERTPAANQLNFHHLRYFWMVATEGHLTRAARRLRVSQSALSTQIRLLEAELGHELFAREGRTLELTETGRMVYAYAQDIFEVGSELVTTLRDGRRPDDMLRIGAVATLSRNFQESFLKPLFADPGARLKLVSGTFEGLLQRLADHGLDVVLSNRPVASDDRRSFRIQRLARQPVSVVGPVTGPRFRFPEDVANVPMLLPTPDSEIRLAFEALCEQSGVRPTVLAEVDDMALLRLLARDTQAMALLPSVVVRDELRTGVLREHCVVADLYEDFYAISLRRHFQHPLLDPLLARNAEELLDMARPGR